MRVIAGEFRSRRLKTTPGLTVRPTPDRLRETLFNIIAPRLPGAVFIDAYAGTGAVGIEALSRGAARCIFVERSRDVVEVIRDNLQALGIGDRARVVPGPALPTLSHQPADIVFLDPPYDQHAEYKAALNAIATNPPKLVVAQHSSRFDPGETHGALSRTRLLRQGENALSFYEVLSL